MASRPSRMWSPASSSRLAFARLELAVCLAIGISISGVGIRELALYAAQFPGSRTIENLKALEQVTPEQLDVAVYSEKNAVAIAGSGADWGNLSLALSTKASLVDEPDRTNLLEQADQAATNSLSKGPASPYIWLKLALIREYLGRPDTATLPYWRLSELTGPNEDRLWTTRIQFGVSHWNSLTPDDRSLLYREIRNLWHRDSIWEIGNDATPLMVSIIRAALVVEPDAFRGYDAFERNRRVWKNLPANKP